MRFAPFVIAIHCFAHRTNLVSGIMGTFIEIQELEQLLASLYNYFSHSPARQEQFMEVQKACNEQLLRLLRDIKTRWISHYGPAVRVWEQYIPLSMFFQASATRKGEHQAAAMNNIRNLMDLGKLLTLVTMLPVLRILKHLVLVCQRSDIFVLELSHAVRQATSDLRQLRTFDHLDFPELSVVWKASDPSARGLAEGRGAFRFVAEAGREPCLAVMGPAGEVVYFTVSSTDRRPVTISLFQSSVQAAGVLVRDIVTELEEEIHSRFPSVKNLDAAAPVYADFWAETPANSVFLMAMEDIKQQYCVPRKVGKDGVIVQPLLCATALDEQRGRFARACRDVAPSLILRRNVARATAAATAAAEASARVGVVPAKPAAHARSATSEMWELFTQNPLYRDKFPEYAKLAQLVLVMVGGSVENERTFSTLTHVKNDLRNRLEVDHLNICLRLFSTSSMYTYSTFPYARAFQAWSSICQRRAVNSAT